MKQCPYCAEDIQDEAIVCRYCGRDLVKKKRRWWLWLLLFLAGLIWFVVCSITMGVMRDGYLGDYPVFPGIAGVSIATEAKKEALPTKTDASIVLPETQIPLPTSTIKDTPIPAVIQEVSNTVISPSQWMAGVRPESELIQLDSFEACLEYGVMSYAVTGDTANKLEIKFINDKGELETTRSYLPWCLSYPAWTGGRMYLEAHDPELDWLVEWTRDASYFCDIYFHGENVAHESSHSKELDLIAKCKYEN